jgi:hypothetical protein
VWRQVVLRCLRSRRNSHANQTRLSSCVDRSLGRVRSSVPIGVLGGIREDVDHALRKARTIPINAQVVSLRCSSSEVFDLRWSLVRRLCSRLFRLAYLPEITLSLDVDFRAAVHQTEILENLFPADPLVDEKDLIFVELDRGGC